MRHATRESLLCICRETKHLPDAEKDVFVLQYSTAPRHTPHWCCPLIINDKLCLKTTAECMHYSRVKIAQIPCICIQYWSDSIYVYLKNEFAYAGIDAKGLDPDLDCHHLVVNDWKDLEAQQNVCIISMPTVFDPSLAPPGKATIHAYVAANEPYDLWQGLDRKSQEYKKLKVLDASPLCT